MYTIKQLIQRYSSKIHLWFRPSTAQILRQYQSGDISSGVAARRLGVTRVEFMLSLSRYGIPLIDLEPEELASDVDNACRKN